MRFSIRTLLIWTSVVGLSLASLDMRRRTAPLAAFGSTVGEVGHRIIGPCQNALSVVEIDNYQGLGHWYEVQSSCSLIKLVVLADNVQTCVGVIPVDCKEPFQIRIRANIASKDPQSWNCEVFWSRGKLKLGEFATTIPVAHKYSSRYITGGGGYYRRVSRGELVEAQYLGEKKQMAPSLNFAAY